MKLSIIIPYYNIEDKYLFRCLANVFNLEIPRNEYEIILIDDGSKYPPKQAKAHYENNKRTVWLSQPHKGLGAARNLGLAHAHGEYILFLDSDDYLYRGILPSLLEYAITHGCDILRFGYRHCTSMQEETAPQPERLQFTPPMNGNNYLRTHHVPSMACIYLFQRSLCMGINLQFAEEGFIEDEAFTAILHYNARHIVETNAILYAYYIRPGSITQSPSPKRIAALTRYHFKAIRELHEYTCQQRAMRRPIQGLERKLGGLTVDLVRRIVIQDHWKPVWKEYAPKLKELKLFPLRHVNYTVKHRLFSLLANTALGRNLLHELLKRGVH